MDSKPSLVLDESCILEYDYSLALKGKVSDFGLLTNLKTVLTKEGFENFNLKYLGGFWVLIEFFMKELLEKFKSHVGVEDDEEDESDDDTLDNESDGEKHEEDLQAHSVNECNSDAVPDTIFSQSQEESKQANKTNIEDGDIQSKDPFNIYDLLVKKHNNDNKEEESFKATLKYPPSFTPDDVLRSKDIQDVVEEVEVQVFKQKSNAQVNSTKDNSFRGVTYSKEEDKESYCLGYFRSSEGPQTGVLYCK
nr:nucleotide-binding alpha-beta plait domain-containing protein [Tanacetum cinerariifolium]